MGSRPPRVKKTSYPVTYNLHAALRRSQGLRVKVLNELRDQTQTLCRSTYGREELDHQKTHRLTLFGTWNTSTCSPSLLPSCTV